MRSKERVLNTLAHKEPDRIPFDLGATVDTSIHYMAFNDLLCYLGRGHLAKEKEDTRFIDIVQSVMQLDTDFIREFKVDVRGLVPGNYGLEWGDVVHKEGDEHFLIDSFGAKWVRPADGYYFDQKPDSFPLANITSEADIEGFAWPDLGGPERLRGLRKNIEELGEEYAIVMGDPVGGIFAQSFRLRGYTNFYLDLAGNPRLAASLMGKLTDLKINYWDRVLDEAGDLIDVVMFEDDLGQQDRPLISPRMYRELVKTHHQRLFSFIKDKTSGSTRVMLHSDGSIYDIIPDLIEIGLDILNPIQVSSAKMGTGQLKKEFGSDIVFWGGGVDTQGVLVFGSRAEVRDEVRRRIDDLAPGGGFVFAAIHNIQPGVRPENIMVMWETLQKYGKY